MRLSVQNAVAAALSAAAVLVAAGAALGQSNGEADAALTAARYTDGGDLEFPANTDEWIVLGTGIGGGYEEGVLDPANPGPITVAQIEPSAYRYLLEHGRYADGTMLLLTFYRTQEKPEPALRGFVQGDVALREIHVIDRERYPEEGRAFFQYPPGTAVSEKLPLGSECVACHAEHGAFDGTFTQFYPPVRRFAD
ncbi:MAG TPA: cytochrome P460 family protein [Gammaproteobacteria bacterium]